MTNEITSTSAFNRFGLDAMGRASGQLAARWAGVTPTYDPNAMTLTLPEGNPWRVMMGGVLVWHAFGSSGLSDATGASLTGVVGVINFHPHAALRIQRLIGARFDGRTDGTAARPTPFYAAIRGGAAPDLHLITETGPPLAPIDAPVVNPETHTGNTLTHGTLTFHDELGLIIDPVAVACLFRDLMLGFPALRNSDAGSLTDLSPGTAGGLGDISLLSSGIGRRLHIVNLFGGPWIDRPASVGLRLESGPRLGSGPHDWPDGQNLNATAPDPSDLKFGFSPEGTLRSTPLLPPRFPGTVIPPGSNSPVLQCEFFRVIAVDLGLHLKGNRTGDAIEEVPGVDAATVLEPAPIVRDGDTIDILGNGQITLGAVTEVAVRPGLRLAVSPTISTNVAFPTSRADRWPVVPATTEVADALDVEHSRLARTRVNGRYVGHGPDIILSWPAGSLPAEAHVRVFPRVDPGPAIFPLAELDFSRRGDGASGIAKSAGLTLMVKDPYRVGTGTAPSDPTLRFDLLIVTRAGGEVRGRLFGGLEVPIETDGVSPAQTTVSNALAALPQRQMGISPAPLLGLRPTVNAAGSDPVLGTLGEAEPRESPRFRTMARTETTMTGHDGATPGVWQSILTAGFLDARSVQGDARLGNPGNPAGPEEHAPGILATGQLGLDLARAALRRTHHLITRLSELNDQRWNVPSAGGGTIAGTVLQNVAQTVESPELDLLSESVVHGLPGNWNDLRALLPPSLHALSGAIPTSGAEDRWVEETRREAFSAKHGRRDSQWSWRWTISHARRLIYLETPLFSATAVGSTDHEVDLVALLRTRLETTRDLRVIIITPKRIPFGPRYESFAQRFHLARNEAVTSLLSVAPKRVVVCHPLGFPGRPESNRGTFAVVDDVWALLGSSSFSRRGLTFDGSLDVVFVDKEIKRGVSHRVSEFRRQAMARILGLHPPTHGETANANWVRLTQQRSAFEFMRELIERGGDGLVEPLWPGLPETELLPIDKDIADPDGRGFPAVLGMFADLLARLGPDHV